MPGFIYSPIANRQSPIANRQSPIAFCQSILNTSEVKALLNKKPGVGFPTPGFIRQLSIALRQSYLTTCIFFEKTCSPSEVWIVRW